MITGPYLVALILALTPVGQLHSQALNQARGGPTGNLENLNDQEKYTSETYVHDGLTQRMIKEACEKDETMQKACAGANVDPEFMGISGTMFQALAKAYTMVVGAGGLGELEGTKSDASSSGSSSNTGSSSQTNSDAASQTEGQSAEKEEKEDTQDYCKYIAMGTEAVAMVQQTASQQSLNTTPLGSVSNAQKEALYRASRSHSDRAQNAKIQTYGWGTSTVCYGAMMLRPSISKSSWKNWLKLGSSALMTAFFNSQVKGHEKYAKTVKEIADKLPEPGDCNPVTERNCYCAQPETQYDPSYCEKEIHKKKVADSSYKISCMDDKAQADEDCSCVNTDSCLDKKFMDYIKGLGFNETMNKNVVTPLNKFSKGELVGGKLTGSDISQASMAKKVMDQLKDQMPDDGVSLNKSQQAEAKMIESMGIPGALARRMAAMPLTSEAKSLADKFGKGAIGSGNQGQAAAARSYNNGNVLTFQGGQNNKGRGTSSNSFDYKKFMPKKGKSAQSGQVLDFAKQAEARAQIHRGGDDRNIFHIISRRYQVTGWNKLGYE